MASSIPASLRTADITRFAIRAGQVEKVKPAAAYWCYYYVLEKLLNQGLHKTDEESEKYVVSLMDKVEQMKTRFPEDDAIRDDTAGKAYIEQFGTETFLRADNAIRANKASKNTADTFQAALTFLDVLHVWPPVDQEVTDKIKYAKYHAVRIAKAVKAGEDPNASNPVVESEESNLPALDATDPEVQAITGTGPAREVSRAVEPTSEDSAVQSETAPHFTDDPPVSLPEAPVYVPPYPNENSSQKTQAMPSHSSAEEFYSKATQPDVSPLPTSEGGDYFPQVPREGGASLPKEPSQPTSSFAPSPANQATHGAGPSDAASAHPASVLVGSVHRGAPQAPSLAPPGFRPPPAQFQEPSASPAQLYAPVASEVNDEAMVRAQKHARFAISALNFEDVATAVKELRAALADLGQQ